MTFTNSFLSGMNVGSRMNRKDQSGLGSRFLGGQGSSFGHKGGMINPMNWADLLKKITLNKRPNQPPELQGLLDQGFTQDQGLDIPNFQDVQQNPISMNQGLSYTPDYNFNLDIPDFNRPKKRPNQGINPGMNYSPMYFNPGSMYSGF